MRMRFLAGMAVSASIVVLANGADGRTRAKRYVEFLARPSTCVVGHGFVQIGTLHPDGAPCPDATVGLYPAAYPRSDVAAIFRARGQLMKTPDDDRMPVSARYRLEVSEGTYHKALAHAQTMKATWRTYDLLTENCNAVLFEFAERLGLAVKRDMTDLPVNIVRGIEAGNTGRARASWRPASR